MARPTLERVTPSEGSTQGGDLVQLVGEGIAARVDVRFGETSAEVLAVRPDAARTVVDLRTPPHSEARVAVAVQNLSADGAPIPGEHVSFDGAYRFSRPDLTVESDLARVVRALLRMLKRDLLENTSTRVAVDYADERHVDGMRVVPIATLPALVLSGPTEMPENRVYSTNEAREEVVAGPRGPEIIRVGRPYTVDVRFQLTGSSNHTLELLNLQSAVARVLHRAPWLELPIDPRAPEAGHVRWELSIAGAFRTRLDGPDGIGAFTVDVLIRGFDLADGVPLDRGARVRAPSVVVGPPLVGS